MTNISINIPERLLPYLKVIEKAEGTDFETILEKMFCETVMGHHPLFMIAHESNKVIDYSPISKRYILKQK